MSGFVHLHNHTEHSSLDGLGRIKSICQTAKDLGQNAMSITDHGSLAGTWKFVKAAKAAGVKPIIGMEAYMAIGDRFERNSVTVERNDDGGNGDADEGKGDQKVKRYEHLTLIARTAQGWKNLLAIHNKAENSYWYKPRADYALLKEHGEGLIILSGCLAGPVAGPLSRGNMEEARTNLDTLVDCVGQENVYLEIMDHGIAAEKSILKGIKTLSEETGIPMVVTNDCHYEHEADADHHDGFLAVGTGANLDQDDRFSFNGSGYHIKSEEEMRAIRPNSQSWQDAVSMSQVIADRCEDCVIPEPKMRLPKYDIPEGFASSEEYLYHLAKEGAKSRYAADTGKLPAEVKERLRTELDIINNMGFADYFLITWDFIAWCRSQGITMGLGRGSAAGSCLSYCLKIVGVDPLENNLLFERFLEPGRQGMPDIDIDVESSRRGEAMAYLARRWGAANVAQIGGFGIALSKAAIKDAARILKPSGSDKASKDRAIHLMRLGNKMSDLVPTAGGKAYTFAQLSDSTDESSEAFRQLVADEGDDAAAILEMAGAFEGIVKTETIHPCGFVVSPEPLGELVPLRKASHAKNADPDAPLIICWDGGDVEEYGMLKMDVLGIANLDIVASALRNIEHTTGEKLVFEEIPHPNTKGNPKVDAAWDLISAGRTGGIFQMDSGGMQKIAQDVAPRSLTDLSAVVALFRPGPLAAKVPDRFAARKNGSEEIDYSIFTNDQTEQEWIAKVLGDTYGVFVFQESLMLLGTAIAGFDAAGRSKLRKAVGKKKADVMAEVGRMLIEGAPQEHHDEEGNLISPVFSVKTAEHMFELMKGSASYLFNASHSAAYAQLAYITAYLKANWPVEYGAGILSVAHKEDKRLTALSSLAEDGIEVLAPDLNKSLARTAPVNGSVLMGLAEVKGVGSAGHHIVAEREKNGPFTSLHDVLNRVTVPADNASGISRLPSTALHGLIEAGGLDAFGDRLGLLMTLRAAQQVDLEPIDASWSDLENSTRQRLRLGVSLGTHPLIPLKDELKNWRAPGEDENGDRIGGKFTKLHKIADTNGQSVQTLGVISSWEEKGYSGGRRANFTLESSKLTVRGVIWDRTLGRLRRPGQVPKVGDVVGVSGTVNVRTTVLGDEESGAQETVTTKELNINEVWRFHPDQSSPSNKVTITEQPNIIDFAAKYRELRSTPDPAPKTRKRTAAPAKKEAALTGVVKDEDPFAEQAPAQERLAPVAVLDDHRPDRSNWTVIGLPPMSTTIMGPVLAGDDSLQMSHRGLKLPDEIDPSGVHRCICANGDVLYVVGLSVINPEAMTAAARRAGPEHWTRITDADTARAGYEWAAYSAEARSDDEQPEPAAKEMAQAA